MAAGLTRGGNLPFRCAIFVVGEANVQRLVDEEQMAKQIPRVLLELRLFLIDPHWANFRISPEERAGSGSALQPDNERYFTAFG